MLSILLLCYMININATILCSDENSVAFVDVKILGSDKTVLCHGDTSELFQYSYKGQIYLDG